MAEHVPELPEPPAAQTFLMAMLDRIGEGLPKGVEVALVVVAEGKLACGGSAEMSEERRRAALTAAIGADELGGPGPADVSRVMAKIERILMGSTTGPDVGMSVLATLLCKTWREQSKNEGESIDELFAVMRKIDRDVCKVLGIPEATATPRERGAS
jgi:hypothetical protein